MNEPLILVTNDDGVLAPGIKALAEALAAQGEVFVVAPDREVSACAQSLTLKHPLRVEQVADRTYSVDGTPADCVNLAIVKLLPRRPELVVSGINRGPNLGEDVFYSGTVGGAREGSFFGVPSIAVSLAARGEAVYTAAAAFASRLASMVMDKGLPERTILNVNVPAGEPAGAVVTVQGRREHEGTVLEGLDPRRRTYYWIEEGKDRWMTDDMSDIHAVRRGLISITPLHNDTTHHAVLQAFRAWEPTLLNGNGAAGPKKAKK
ncbi:MAG TPA: 5'/3'-nucleotidase SurE [Vicinamibacteria bacterium]|nr:5'/3'-nucleotidase SurE [Vicinamibacteria bacterium]